MGHAAIGPVLLGAGDRYISTHLLLSGETLQPIEGSDSKQSRRKFECDSGCIVRASANGQVFTSKRSDLTPSGFNTLLINRDGSERVYSFHDSYGILSPNANGSRIYTDCGTYSDRATLISKEPGDVLLPSVTGDFYMRFRVESPADPMHVNEIRFKLSSMTLHWTGDPRPLATIPDLLTPPYKFRTWASETPSDYFDRQVNYFPELKCLVLLNPNGDGFEFMTLDAVLELEKSEIDYLLITSCPPLTADSGKPFTYQVDVASKNQEVDIRLASGPDGMQVDGKGKVIWAVPKDACGEVDVILTANDTAGKEVIQAFRLQVGDAPAGAVLAPPPVVAGLNPTVAPAVVGKLPEITPTKIKGDEVPLKLPAAADAMEIGGGGRYAVVHLTSLRKLAVIDLCEVRISGYIPVEDRMVSFAVGANKLIVALGEQQLLSRWDLITLKREVTVPSEGSILGIVMGALPAVPRWFLRANTTTILIDTFSAA